MTQKEKVLNYIQKNGTITSFECMLKLRIMDLQGVIRDLKIAGYNIKSQWVKKNNKVYKVYALTNKELAKVVE